MKDVINSTQICHFLDDVEHNFPNFVAAVISDFKVKVALNEDKSVRLLLLLNKPKNYLNGFKNLKRIVQRQMLF
jgi:hypothetical protein